MKRAVEEVFKRSQPAQSMFKKKKTYRTEVSIVSDATSDTEFLVLVEIDLNEESDQFKEAKTMVLADATVQRLLSQGDKLEFEELVREAEAQ